MINYGKHFIDNEDIKSVIRVLKSNFLTQGPKILEFENALKKKFGAKHAVCTSSGTSSLHLCGLALKMDKKRSYTCQSINFCSYY